MRSQSQSRRRSHCISLGLALTVHLQTIWAWRKDQDILYLTPPKFAVLKHKTSWSFLHAHIASIISKMAVTLGLNTVCPTLHQAHHLPSSHIPSISLASSLIHQQHPSTSNPSTNVSNSNTLFPRWPPYVSRTHLAEDPFSHFAPLLSRTGIAQAWSRWQNPYRKRTCSWFNRINGL